MGSGAKAEIHRRRIGSSIGTADEESRRRSRQQAAQVVRVQVCISHDWPRFKLAALQLIS
jgi:hypothetical protein